MGTKILKGKFMPQYRTAAQWRAADPVLLRGELAVESDTLKFKFGDGVNHWNDLEYANDIQLGTNILNGSHADWVAAFVGGSGYATGDSILYLDHTSIRGKQITYRVELKGEDAQAYELGFEIKVHFTDNTDQWIARYTTPDIPDRGTFEKTYTFSSQVQDKEIVYARLYPVFRSLGGGEVSGKLYVRHEFVGVGNTLPSTWSPSIADPKVVGPIMISDAESISKAVTSVEWRELGQIRPVIIFDPAGVAGLPADVPSNCTLVGNVQKVDDGTISSDDGYVVTLNVFQEDNFLSGIWYQILLNSAGEVIEEKKYSLGGNAGESLPFDGPIPGYTKIVSSWSSAVAPGSTGVINFNQEVPSNTKLLIEATIQSSPAATATIRAKVPLTFAGLNSTGQGIVFEINSLYLSTGTTVGAIKLICTSVITGANGVQGMNVLVQSNNLANPGDIIQINGIYAKIEGGGNRDA